jgi:hypothetical protein
VHTAPALIAALTCFAVASAAPALAKPAPVKQKAPATAAKKPNAKPEPAQAAASPLRQDPLLARLLASLDKALSAKPDPADPAAPDLASAVLIGMARTSLVATLHGHFALAGLGHALRGGGMKPDEVATMAATMAQNYKGLSETFLQLAGQKAFEGELAQLWREVAGLAKKGQTAAEALRQVALNPSESAHLAPFDAALEDYRSSLQALMTALQGGQK